MNSLSHRIQSIPFRSGDARAEPTRQNGQPSLGPRAWLQDRVAGRLTAEEALTQVESTHSHQVGLSAGGYALIGLGASAVVIGVIRW